MNTFASPFLKPPPAYVASERTRRRIRGEAVYEWDAPSSVPKPAIRLRAKSPQPLTGRHIMAAVAKAWDMPLVGLEMPSRRGGFSVIGDAKAAAAVLLRDRLGMKREIVGRLLGFKDQSSARNAEERGRKFMDTRRDWRERFDRAALSL